MEIINSTLKDREAIFKLYDQAVAYQKTKFKMHWLPFEPQMVENEIKENRQWKIVENGEICCIFVTAYSDPFIWKELDKDPSIYLHRIVTDPKFKGRGFVKLIIEWAKYFGKQHGKKFIRMDTWGDNEELINYYINCGFTFLKIIDRAESDTLPAHYSATSLSLFEITI